MALHQRVTEGELRDWIVEAVRRKSNGRALTAHLTFVQFHTAASSGATWDLDSALARDAWDRACLDAFEAVVRQAQRTFDLID
jgi:hypothetical protein